MLLYSYGTATSLIMFNLLLLICHYLLVLYDMFVNLMWIYLTYDEPFKIAI